MGQLKKNWYALYTKPNKEIIVISHIRMNKVEFYFPMININPVNPQSLKVKPFFPRYLFARMNSQKISENDVKWMPGLSRIISSDDGPVVVPDQLIDLIRQQVEEYNAKVNDTNGNFQKGDPVIVREGPFAGYRGIFDLTLSDKKRVRILLELICDQFTRLELPVEQIQRKTRR